MTQLQDWPLRYGVILGKRFTEKQKIAFLRSLTKDFQELGYAVDTTKSYLRLGKNERQAYYNLYAGDFKKAKQIIAVSYETPAKTFGLIKKRPFHLPTASQQFIQILPAILLTVIAAILFWQLVPSIQAHGFVSVWGVLALILLAGVFFFIARYRSGIPNRVNFSQNSAAILAALSLAKKDPALAFVFFDGGATNGYGLQLLEDYLKGKKKVVFLEGLTDTELTETKAGKPYPETARYFTTKGAETSSLKLAGTRKDAAFDEALLEKHVETLLTYLR